MKILILSSSSLHFPLDIQASLKEAGLEAHRLQSLNEFISSPLRKEPFLAVLEVGNTEDIDRALVAYEWAETVQPLAAARYLLLVGSKHISLQEKSNRFRGVEIAQLPLPLKNLLFKVELQLKVLSSESKNQAEKKTEGFSAEIREVDKQRVMVIRGMGPKEGNWKNGGETPQGRIRWRWIDDPPKKGKPEEKFSWSAESKTKPEFSSAIDGWEVKDPEADLQCHRDGKEIFSAKKSGQLPTAKAENPANPPNKAAPAPSTEKNISPASSTVAAAGLGSSAKNNLVTPALAAEKSLNSNVSSEPKSANAAAPTVSFSSPQKAGVNPLPAGSHSQPEAPIPSASTPNPAPAASTPPTRETKAPMPSAGVNEPSQKAAAPAAPLSSPVETKGEAPAPRAAEKPAGEKKTEPAIPATAIPPENKHNPASAQSANQAEERKGNEKAQEIPPIASTRATGTLNTATLNASASTGEKSAGESNAPASAAPMNTPTPISPATSSPQAVAPKSEPPKAEPAAPAPKAHSASSSPTAPVAASPQSKVAEPAPAAVMGNNEPKKTESHSVATNIKVSTEVIRTIQERPAEQAKDTAVQFPEHTREITGKIVIPTSTGQSDPQNLVSGSESRSSSERNVISSSAGKPEEAAATKTRLFLTLSLEEMQDQNSSWMPVEGYRIYLSARHRYYGLRDINEIFPLWVYEGELPPEFLDLQRSWKFYDRLPISHGSLESLPAPVARYLVDLAKAKAQAVAEGMNPDASATEKPGLGAKGPTAGESAPSSSAFSAENPKPAPAANGIFGAIKRILGLRD